MVASKDSPPTSFDLHDETAIPFLKFGLYRSLIIDLEGVLLKTDLSNEGVLVKVVEEMFGAVKKMTGKVRVFCVTKSSTEELKSLRNLFPEVFELFERTFTSDTEIGGTQKSHPKFFKHLMYQAGIQASETVLIDSSLETVISAESTGITCILASNTTDETLRKLILILRGKEERIAAARDYLWRTRGMYKSLVLTHEGYRFPVLFDHFVVAEILNDARFLPIDEAPESGVINFFPKDELQRTVRNAGNNSFSHRNFPDDCDSTSIGLSSLYKFSRVSLELINKVLDRMQLTIPFNPDGLLQVYFDVKRPRIEPVGLMNILYLFHLAGRTELLKASEDFVYNLLERRAYVRGTMYYRSPDCFLFHLARLVFEFRQHFEKAGFVDLITSRIRERVGMPGDALSLGMRIFTCNLCGIQNNRDAERLSCMQNTSGSWEPCPYYTYNDPKSWFGNEAVSTAFAVVALEAKANLPTNNDESFRVL